MNISTWAFKGSGGWTLAAQRSSKILHLWWFDVGREMSHPNKTYISKHGSFFNSRTFGIPLKLWTSFRFPLSSYPPCT